ncbi:unnamed protein product [Chilo suppressalis]|uniref:Knottins-like domain-containing protein n=1 Tax=Chilo suppressalis TaxID=168631 RepID=A0ABN8APM5_CHISP|nr:unnamed protein product [Chilo suppressalis]
MVRATTFIINAHDGDEIIGNKDLSIDTYLFGSCVSSQCNVFCRLIGYAHGYCVNDKVCRCSRRLASVAALADVTSINNHPTKVVKLETSVHSCVNSQCQDFCRHLGFARGICLTDNTCQCTGPLALDATLKDVAPGTIDANTMDSDSESTAENKSKDMPQYNKGEANRA